MSEPGNPKILKLTKPWANHPAGSKFAVLEPGENPAPGKVDPARAATLLADGFATDVEFVAPSFGAPAAQKSAKASQKKEA